jgi:hypothetical protein
MSSHVGATAVCTMSPANWKVSPAASQRAYLSQASRLAVSDGPMNIRTCRHHRLQRADRDDEDPDHLDRQGDTLRQLFD